MKKTIEVVVMGACSVMVLSLLVAGCGRRGGEPETTKPGMAATAGELDPSALNEVFVKVDEFMMNNATNEAVAVMEAAMVDPVLAEHQQTLFSHLLRLLLYTDQVAAAEERMLEVCRDDHSLAVAGLGLVYSYHIERGDVSKAVEWTERVMALDPLPEEVRRSMREWNLMGYISLEDEASVQEVVSQFMRVAPTGGVIEILSRAIDHLFERKQSGLVEKILQKMGQVVSSDLGSQHLVVRTRLRLQAERKEWNEIEKGFGAAAAKLPDGELQHLLRQLLQQVNAAGELKLAENICTTVIEKESEKKQSLSVAARQWIDMGMRVEPALLPERLNRLLEAKLPLRQLCSHYMRHFYQVIDMPETIAAMKSLGSRLAPLAEDDETRNAIRTMVLDASFVLEDYATALDILEKGIAGREPSWHAMAISKVKAHKALIENRPRDAVKHFREFMTTIATSSDDEPTSDPATGLIHSREMILGRNAKRIGDIFAAIPDMAAAGKAYTEARGYYQKALELESDQEVIKLIKSELDEVP